MNTPPVRPELIALDLDGTLIGSDLKVTSRTHAALNRARAEGVLVTIVTGRMFGSARPFARVIGVDGPIVCYQGAAIYAAGTGELLRHVPLASATALQIAGEARAAGLHVQLYADDRLYVEEMNDHARMYAQLARIDPIVVRSLEEEFAGRDSTKLVVVADARRAAEFAERLASEYAGRAYVTRSQAEFVEALDPRVDKGGALAFVARRLGVSLERTLAVGDSWNDLPLLRAAGFSVAMGTAPAELQAVADAIVAGVEHDGVAQAVEWYVLDVPLTAAS